MNWNEVQLQCLEQRLKDEETLKVSLAIDIKMQEKIIEGIKEEIERIRR